MAVIIDLLADLMDGTDLPPSHAEESWRSKEARACDGCGEAKLDVDIWATNDITGETLCLCEACGSWD